MAMDSPVSIMMSARVVIIIVIPTQLAQTKLDPSVVPASLAIAEMASIVLMTTNVS